MRSAITSLTTTVEAMQAKLGKMEEDKQNTLKTINTFQAELKVKHSKSKVTNNKSLRIRRIVGSRASSTFESTNAGESWSPQRTTWGVC